MYLKYLVLFLSLHLMVEGLWTFNPLFSSQYPYPSANYGGPPPPPLGIPNITGKPWGPWGPFGPWGPYGPYNPSSSVLPPYVRAKRSLPGLGLFSPFASLYPQLVGAKLEGISQAIIAKKQYKDITAELNDKLTVAKAGLESQLDSLNLSSEQQALQAQQTGRDLSQCTEALQGASEQITQRINALDVDVEDTPLGKSIGKDIHFLKAQAGSGIGKWFKGCKLAAQDCTTDPKESSAENQLNLINEKTSNLQAETEELIKNTTNEVNALINQADNNFKACSDRGKAK